MIQVSVAKDFSDSPGGRFRKDGDNSGEAFREDVLIPKFTEAFESGKKLLLDLDGTFGYPTSFISEVFEGMVEYIESVTGDYESNCRDLLLKTVEIKTDDEPELKTDIMEYIFN